MKSIIIYCSDYKNNTEKVARIFSEKMDSELVNIRNITDVDIENYNLIGFGSGVYKENLSPKLFRLIEKLDLRDKNVFVFSTSGFGMRFYNNKLIKFVMAKGAVNIGSFACKGSFVAREFSTNKLFEFLGRLSEGHPNEKDFKNAQRFIKGVADSLDKN